MITKNILVAGLLAAGFKAAIFGYNWQPYPEKCALMVVHAHADDEAIFFGGAIPYYAVVRNLPVIDVLMTDAISSVRANELRAACWTYGLRYEPVFLEYNGCCLQGTLDDTWKVWGGKDGVVKKLVQQIRRFKPDVILTHDFNGEYGHPNHIATAIATAEACKAASDPLKYPDAGSAWTVKKCYVHLYPENRFFHCWDRPFESLKGKTARQVANDGLLKHVSQGAWSTGGINENSRFWGLYYTTVGPDIIGENDFFENVDINNYAGAVANPYTPPSSDTTPPPAPSNLRIVSTYATMIELAWDSVVDDIAGVSKYLFYQNGQKLTGLDAFHFENFVLVKNLNPNTSYSFAVRARDYRGNESSLSIPITASTINFDGLLISYTETEPSIDGNVDQMWNRALGVTVGRKLTEGAVSSAADCCGTLRALWNTSALYLMITVSDDTLKKDSPSEPWLDDAIEIYLDLGNQKSSKFDSDDNQLVFPWAGTSVVTQVPLKTGTVRFKTIDIANGYQCEIAIPWASVGTFSAAENFVIGFELALDDDDNGAKRDAQICWWGNEKNFTTPALWGNAKLVRENPHSFNVENSRIKHISSYAISDMESVVFLVHGRKVPLPLDKRTEAAPAVVLQRPRAGSPLRPRIQYLK